MISVCNCRVLSDGCKFCQPREYIKVLEDRIQEQQEYIKELEDENNWLFSLIDNSN